MYEYDDDEGGGGRPFIRILIGLVAVAAMAGAVWFVANGRSSGEDQSSAVLPVDPSSTAAGEPQTTAPGPPTTLSGPQTTAVDPAAVTPSTSEIASVTEVATTVEEVTATTRATTTVAPVQVTTTTRAPRRTTTTTAPRRPRRPDPPRTYDTLPDGTPVPVVAIFDVDQITLTGAVPDQAAKDRLQALALANAKPGQDNVVNFLTINPDVPRSVGVRVIELTSTRFPTGSAEIRPAHAQELDRVVAIMSALPNITALVIGHSDQRGDELGNYVLSAERAEAVINYLAGQGIAPNRLSSRAVGESDLLTLNNDEAALALNRRTEFVFYGLLIE